MARGQKIIHLFLNDLPFCMEVRSDHSSQTSCGLPSVIRSLESVVFNSSKIFCISSLSKSTFSESASLSSKMNFPHRPDVPNPPQSDLQLRLSILFTPEILTELSAIFPAKNPNIPKSNSFGLFNFILIVRFGESRSFRKSE